MQRAEKKLWKWLVGQTRSVEASRRQKKGDLTALRIAKHTTSSSQKCCSIRWIFLHAHPVHNSSASEMTNQTCMQHFAMFQRQQSNGFMIRKAEMHGHVSRASAKAEKKGCLAICMHVQNTKSPSISAAGWLKWLKQGGAAQLGRERARQQQWDPHSAYAYYRGTTAGGSSGGSTYTYGWSQVCSSHQES